MAWLERMASLPPRRMQALADLEGRWPHGVGGDVGAGLEDDGDDAEGNAAFFDAQSVGAVVAFDHLADGIGLGGDVAQPLGHGDDFFGGELEAGDQGRGDAILLCLREIGGVFGEQFGLGYEQAVGDIGEREIFLRAGDGGQLAGGGAGLVRHLLNCFRHRAGGLRCGHDKLRKLGFAILQGSGGWAEMAGQAGRLRYDVCGIFLRAWRRWLCGGGRGIRGGGDLGRDDGGRRALAEEGKIRGGWRAIRN